MNATAQTNQPATIEVESTSTTTRGVLPANPSAATETLSYQQNVQSEAADIENRIKSKVATSSEIINELSAKNPREALNIALTLNDANLRSEIVNGLYRQNPNKFAEGIGDSIHELQETYGSVDHPEVSSGSYRLYSDVFNNLTIENKASLLSTSAEVQSIYNQVGARSFDQMLSNAYPGDVQRYAHAVGCLNAKDAADVINYREEVERGIAADFRESYGDVKGFHAEHTAEIGSYLQQNSVFFNNLLNQSNLSSESRAALSASTPEE